MSETNGKAMFQLPGWAKAIAWIGIPGTIALYFAYMNGQILPNIQQEILLGRVESQKTQEMLKEHLLQQQDNYRLLLRICTNTAKTPDAAQACFDTTSR